MRAMLACAVNKHVGRGILRPMSHPISSPVPAAFVIESYADLVRALRARRKALGLSQLELDLIAGWAEGYTSKLEISESNPAAKNARAIGRDSLPLALGALKAKLVLVPAGSLKIRNPVTAVEKGRRGAEARQRNTTPEQRREIARKAAQARWTMRPKLVDKA